MIALHEDKGSKANICMRPSWNRRSIVGVNYFLIIDQLDPFISAANLIALILHIAAIPISPPFTCRSDPFDDLVLSNMMKIFGIENERMGRGKADRQKHIRRNHPNK
jgi:hypothetical protein